MSTDIVPASWHQHSVDLAKAAPRHHEARLLEIGEQLVFEGEAQRVQTLSAHQQRTLTEKEERRIRNQQVRGAINHLQAFGLVSTWESLLVQWVLMPFLHRLFLENKESAK